MRTGLLLAVAMLCAVAGGAGQEPGKAARKCGVEHLEKAFGIAAKSVRLGSKAVASQEFVITLEFEKDAEDEAAVQAAFRPRPKLKGDVEPAAVYVYLFDEENVAIQKLPIERVEGEVTGKKGDAFRVYATAIVEADRVRRVEVRSTGTPRRFRGKE